MAVPTEAFVYCWTDNATKKLYIGYHLGNQDDGYVSSSKHFNQEYTTRPLDFSRQIIAHGSRENCLALERALLEAVSAAKSQEFYNKHNGGKKFHCSDHTEETKKKMSMTWKSRGSYNCDNTKGAAAWKGSKHSVEARQIMSASVKERSHLISEMMTKNNPMKSKESIAKMLASRARNRSIAK